MQVPPIRKSVVVHSRLGESKAETDGVVAVFDHSDLGAGRPIRHYLLLQENAKLMHEPWGWVDHWYVDFVRIVRTGDTVIEIEDLFVDVIVEGEGPIYRMIDLDELGAALASGKLGSTELQQLLCDVQQFLDNHLHGKKDFPPGCIHPFMP